MRCKVKNVVVIGLEMGEWLFYRINLVFSSEFLCEKNADKVFFLMVLDLL